MSYECVFAVYHIFCTFAFIQYRRPNMRIERLYLPPECEYEVTSPEELICTSPTEGGLEGITEEDWVI